MTAIVFKNEKYSLWNRIGGASDSYRQLDERIINVFRHLDAPVTLGNRAGTRRQVRSILNDCDTTNWDGYGANPVTPAAAENAIAVLRALPRYLDAPEVSPLPDGGIGLSWPGSPANAFSIAVDSSDVVAYAGIAGKDTRSHGTFVFDDNIPEEITRKIRALEI